MSDTVPTHRPTRRRTPSFLLVTAGAAMLAATTACQGPGGDDRPAADRQSDASSGATGQPRSGSLDERTPIATRDTDFDDSTIRFDLISLRRSGNLATLRFTATNTSPGTAEDNEHEWLIGTDLGSGSSDYTVAGVYLVDPVNSKRYPVAVDSADDCVCSETSGVTLPPTQDRELSATFAAPAAGVRTVDVYVPGAGTFENVPVS